MRDLFGAEAAVTTPSRRAQRSARLAASISTVTTVTDPAKKRSVRQDQSSAPALDPSTAAASFSALGAEVCMASPLGALWLVPRYTDAARSEISADDMARLVVAHATFPGSRITSFKTEHTNPQSGTSSEAEPPDARSRK